jgi:hypothetical protein
MSRKETAFEGRAPMQSTDPRRPADHATRPRTEAAMSDAESPKDVLYMNLHKARAIVDLLWCMTTAVNEKEKRYALESLSEETLTYVSTSLLNHIDEALNAWESVHNAPDTTDGAPRRTDISKLVQTAMVAVNTCVALAPAEYEELTIKLTDSFKKKNNHDLS